jgi:hypothetical protein
MREARSGKEQETEGAKKTRLLSLEKGKRSLTKRKKV